MSRPSRTRPMNIRHTPDTVAAPFGPYSHAVEVPEGSRLLYISGEVGVLPDGTVPETIEAQAEACWQPFFAWVAAAGDDYNFIQPVRVFAGPARHRWAPDFLRARSWLRPD